MRLTPVQHQLLSSIQARGGRVRSLYRLTDELGIDYRHAHDCVVQLEHTGLIDVARSPGLPMVLTIRS